MTDNDDLVDENEAGIFVWSLDSDTPFADSFIASLFGLDPRETTTGLPLARYLSRVFPEDRTKLSKLIAQAVRDGQPYKAEYRVIDKTGGVRWVIALGRCFRDKTGNPVQHAGIVYPLDRLE